MEFTPTTALSLLDTAVIELNGFANLCGEEDRRNKSSINFRGFLSIWYQDTILSRAEKLALETMKQGKQAVSFLKTYLENNPGVNPAPYQSSVNEFRSAAKRASEHMNFMTLLISDLPSPVFKK